MRNEIERLLAEHGSYWFIALFSVAISKLYTKEDQTLKTVIRSFLAATLFSFLFVVWSSEHMPEWAIAISIAAGSFVIDAIAEGMMFLRSRIKEDPSVLLKFIPYINRGDKK